MIKLISYNPISGSIFIEEDNDFFFCDYPYEEEFREKLSDGSPNRFFDHVICEKEFKDFPELIEFVEKAYIDFREKNTNFIENKKILDKIRNKK